MTFSAAALTLCFGLLGCASGTDDVVARLDASDDDLRDHVAALERSLEASYDREKALSERLRRMEENVAVVQARVAETGERVDGLSRPSAGSSAPAVLDVTSAYSAAYERHREHDYEGAVAAFADIVKLAPTHSLADNAQYWIGESYYGLGRFRQALAAFPQVLAFETTEKEDDAQLMIARSYLSLGEKDQAITAFRRLMTEHPDSEYIEAASKELRYVEGE